MQIKINARLKLFVSINHSYFFLFTYVFELAVLVLLRKEVTEFTVDSELLTKSPERHFDA